MMCGRPVVARMDVTRMDQRLCMKDMLQASNQVTYGCDQDRPDGLACSISDAEFDLKQWNWPAAT